MHNIGLLNLRSISALLVMIVAMYCGMGFPGLLAVGSACMIGGRALPVFLAKRKERVARKSGFGRVSTSMASAVAVVMVACLIVTGCTPAQKQTTLQVVTAINAKLPEVKAAADTVAAMVAALDPDSVSKLAIGVGDVAFDTAVDGLQALVTSYLANPSADTLTQIQNAINALESKLNTATLNAVGIKSTTSQQFAVAALKGLLTVVTIVFGLISATESVAQLYELRKTDTIHLAKLRPYMDNDKLQVAAKSSGVDADAMFRQAEAFGF